MVDQDRYTLDTSAVIAYFADEPGGTEVERLLTLARTRRVALFVSFITFMEVLYRLWQRHGEREGKTAGRHRAAPRTPAQTSAGQNGEGLTLRLERLDPRDWLELRGCFVPDRPGPLIGLHAIHSGCGACWVDRWPGARAGLVFTGGNLACWGDPDALAGTELADVVRSLLSEWDRVFIEVRREFEARVRRALPELLIWPREIFVHRREPTTLPPVDAEVRRLTRSDTEALGDLEEGIRWISDTYGGAAALAETATAWGAFVAGRLVSVAVPYFVGDRYEDIGVVTAAAFRGRGLSPACAARVIADMRARGRTPSWSTSRDNTASRRVAEKLGFAKHRDDVLHIAGKPLPGAVAQPVSA